MKMPPCAVLVMLAVALCAATTEEEDDMQAFLQEKRENLAKQGKSEAEIEVAIRATLAHIGSQRQDRPQEPERVQREQIERTVKLEKARRQLEEAQRSLAQGRGAEDSRRDLAVSAEDAAVTAEPVPVLSVPEAFQVVWETDVVVNGQLQDIVVNITTAFAPLGAEQLYKLVKVRFYDGACFFRVVPNFIIQWGIAADPAANRDWSVPILDDPVEVSNEEGTFVFASAGRDTRTTQVYVNLKDNVGLDSQGFAPLGQIVQGMEALRAVYNPTPGKVGGVDQAKYTDEGNAWLKPKVPKINQIVRGYISSETFA